VFIIGLLNPKGLRQHSKVEKELLKLADIIVFVLIVLNVNIVELESTETNGLMRMKRKLIDDQFLGV